ncbi:MAG: diaminopimelate epimerase [Candidatus Omnitrophica bacterium]|nr:diaminopimelate epimerase [Candidatus Omnitrophota bacterium]
MEKVINFTKMVAAGNDFVVIEDKLKAGNSQLARLAIRLCDRKYGIGADGMLLIGKSKKADIRMRIFNADGSEAEMCGNGARCAAFFASSGRVNARAKIAMETKAGIIESVVDKKSVKVKLTDPKEIKLGIPIIVNERSLRVNFVDTGVPHTIVFVEGIDAIDAHNLGRAIRYHEKFQPKGTNVDFVEIVDDDFIKIRTYERGVEAETLACGTGATASAILSTCHSPKMGERVVKVKTRGGEILKVLFDKADEKVSNVWLEGLASTVYKGVFYV